MPRPTLPSILTDLAERRLLREVAAAAGVSPSTLSRIAHGTRGATPAMVARVRGALEALAASRDADARVFRRHAAAITDRDRSHA